MVATAERVGKVARIGGWGRGLANSGNARIETFFLLCSRPLAFCVFDFKRFQTMAVLYYTSQHFIWWDFGGMTIQDPNTGGIDPNWHHPKPRPTTPQEFFDSIDFQYQKENW